MEKLMSDQNIQVLRDGYAAFARGDMAAVLARLDENIEWTVPDSVPYGGTYHGHVGVAALVQGWGKWWQKLDTEVVEFIDAGDTIVVITQISGTGAHASISAPSVHIWRMRDGKAVSHLEVGDTARTLFATGAEISNVT
jgi:hypothetical protein